MQKIKLYIQDSFNELFHKVTWPSWSELQNSAIIVLIAALIIGLIVFAMDTLFQGLMNLLYTMFGK